MTSSEAPDAALGQQPGTGLHVDAEHNRERILATVAREAGVGEATLSHRFSSREELVNAVFADRLDAYAAATEKGALGDATSPCRPHRACRGRQARWGCGLERWITFTRTLAMRR